jgi:hypothetical protein
MDMFEKLSAEQQTKYQEIITFFREKDPNATDEEIQLGIVAAGIEATYPIMRLARSQPKVFERIKQMGRKLPKKG